LAWSRVWAGCAEGRTGWASRITHIISRLAFRTNVRAWVSRACLGAGDAVGDQIDTSLTHAIG
jgi:hypothetical protein